MSDRPTKGQASRLDEIFSELPSYPNPYSPAARTRYLSDMTELASLRSENERLREFVKSQAEVVCEYDYGGKIVKRPPGCECTSCAATVLIGGFS